MFESAIGSIDLSLTLHHGQGGETFGRSHFYPATMDGRRWIQIVIVAGLVRSSPRIENCFFPVGGNRARAPHHPSLDGGTAPTDGPFCFYRKEPVEKNRHCPVSLIAPQVKKSLALGVIKFAGTVDDYYSRPPGSCAK